MNAPRTCLITGANAGIGRAAAGQLARAGHRVLLGCRDLARGEEAARQLRLASPGASPDEMARTYVWLATDASVRASTGGYWDRVGVPAPVSRWAASAENRAALDALTRAQLVAAEQR